VGIYDRDYYRGDRTGFQLRAPTSIVGYLVLINLGLWLPGFLLETNAVADLLAVRVADIAQPWMWWRLITYGFVHAAQPMHLLANMIGLWFFGREIELVYGRKEFLRLYLLLLLAGSAFWAAVNYSRGMPGVLLGASGAVTGIVILFALHFPRRIVLLMFVLPIPAWLLGVLLVASDMMGATAGGGAPIAYSVHLTGAAVAFLYFYFHWSIGTWIPGGLAVPRLKRRPNLKVHDPGQADEQLSEEVDRILEKISREGEASLTRQERRTLENASRQYQKRRHVDQD